MSKNPFDSHETKNSKFVKVNPSHPIFYLKVGKTEFTCKNDPAMADSVVSFSMNRSTEEVSSDIKLTLFDKTSLLVEYELAKGYKEIQFKYGLDENNLSQMYTATLYEYEPDFTSGGVQLTCSLYLGNSSSQEAQQQEVAKSYEGSNSEVFKKVCEEEGWKVGKVTPCEPNKEAVRRTSKTADAFLRDLASKSRSQSGDTPYTFYKEYDEEGNTVANFTSVLSKDTSDITTYAFIIGRDHESILNFTPAYNGVMYHLFPDVQPNPPASGSGGSSSGAVVGKEVDAEFTAYYPANNTMEGGFYDCKGNKLDPSKNTCAAPKEIPYGTRVMVKGTGTSKDNQVLTVNDRGGAIKIKDGGVYRIDILHPDEKSANAFGRRKGKLVIEGTPSSDQSNSRSKSTSIQPQTRTPSSSNKNSGWTNRDCGIYKGTSRETPLVAKLAKGLEVQIISSTNAWYKINYRGLSGYIMKSSISMSPVSNPNEGGSLPIENSVTPVNPSGSGVGMGTGARQVPLEWDSLDKYTNKLTTIPAGAKNFKRRIGSSSYNGEEMFKIADQFLCNTLDFMYTAQLELRGDVSIKTQSFISMVVLTSEGFFHHSSGLYQVLEITDTIELGEYTTTLNLVKVGMTVNEDGTLSLVDASAGKWGNKYQNSGGGQASTPGVGQSVEEQTLRAACDIYNGCGYSQASRLGTSTYDCSSLVNVILGDLGITVPWSTTHDGIGYKDKWGTKVWESGQGTLTVDMIKPGMIGLYNGGGTGNHTWIFVNQEQMFHAANPKSGVLYGNTKYYVDRLNKTASGKAVVWMPPASSGSPVQNNGVKSRRK